MTDLKNFSEKFLTSPAEGTQAGRHGAQLIKNGAAQQAAMEAFFFGYQAFTAKPDEMLAKRGLSRVHHRILFFIAKYPGLNMTELLGYLGVSKQALNMPLRQLIEMTWCRAKLPRTTSASVYWVSLPRVPSWNMPCAASRRACCNAYSAKWAKRPCKAGWPSITPWHAAARNAPEHRRHAPRSSRTLLFASRARSYRFSLPFHSPAPPVMPRQRVIAP